MQKKVVVTGDQGALGSAVAKRLSESYEIVTSEIDLTDFAKTKEWAESVGPIHGIAALAGGFRMSDLGRFSDEHCAEIFDMNARTAFSTLNAFSSNLSAGSSVILVGSQAYTGANGMSGYAAAKAAVVSLAKSAALEWKPRGIRVNAILPDIIDIPANRSAMPDANFDKWQKPEEIAEVIAFLMSDSAAIVSGNLINLGRI